MLVLLTAFAIPAPASARDTLGVFDGWGAFADPRPRRCYAIAEPDARRRSAAWRPFAAISAWPARGVRAQLNIRLRKAKRRGAPVLLMVGNMRFALVAGGADAWAPNAAIDARIVAAMRQSDSMRIETRARDGSRLVDTYRLRGAATAIDAATLACAPSG
ncbi:MULTISPECIES: hypothetical protein [Sphingomonas]|uniref:Uncharacterized protein n=2 Tax=Sphingomonas TaxID=13687 RepID=A0A7W9BRX9_9SPHN|nr:hypothetical protein [Sphingomonas prati]MBB5728829.1 hypothetical protein [Sphingomonas prati]GGE87206.1 hypothetical protein GCM10011404_20020 [Sphingomonas prati]